MKVLSTKDPSFLTVEKRIVIQLDPCAENPRQMREGNLFTMYTDRPGKFMFDSGNVAPPDDTDVFTLTVSCYDHSEQTYFIEGTGTPYQWDTTARACVLWTTREHYEYLGASDMKWDLTNKKFVDMLTEQAKKELEAVNNYLHGYTFMWKLEERRGWKKTYDDGAVDYGADYFEADSCFGYVTRKIEDFGFRGDVPVFDETGTFVEDEIKEETKTNKWKQEESFERFKDIIPKNEKDYYGKVVMFDDRANEFFVVEFGTGDNLDSHDIGEGYDDYIFAVRYAALDDGMPVAAVTEEFQKNEDPDGIGGIVEVGGGQWLLRRSEWEDGDIRRYIMDAMEFAGYLGDFDDVTCVATFNE